MVVGITLLFLWQRLLNKELERGCLYAWIPKEVKLYTKEQQKQNVKEIEHL